MPSTSAESDGLDATVMPASSMITPSTMSSTRAAVFVPFANSPTAM